jgi:hypothetical protein
MTDQNDTPQPEQPISLSLGEYISNQLNMASNNITTADRLSGGRLTPSQLLKAAQVQAQLAQATAIADLANAVRETATPSLGQSIHFGLSDVVKAVEALKASQDR